MIMKKLFALLMLSACSAVFAAETVKLPPPQKNGGMSLRETLDQRRTVRQFQDKTLTIQQLADILWCANGVNRSNGKRTAPSALDKREVMIFAALP